MDELWLIVAPAPGFGWCAVKVLEANPAFYICEPPPELTQLPSVVMVQEGAYVAKHNSKAAADAALKAAKKAEEAVRPFWQEAVKMESHFRGLMYEAAFAAAQPSESIN